MSHSSAQQFYDDKYRVYNHPAPQTFLEKLHQLLQKYELHRNTLAFQLLDPGKSFLDVGTGDGRLIKMAAEKGFTKLYGIDISPVEVEWARKNLKKSKLKASISCQNIDDKTNFRKHQFDAIAMIAVFEHVFSPHKVLAEINRILKPGGTVIIEVPNVVFLPRRLSFLLGKLPKTADEPNYLDGHLQFFTHESLATLLEQHEFMIEYSGSSGIGHQWRNWMPQLLGANIMIKAIKIKST